MNNKAHLRPKDFDSNGDIIPMACKEVKGDFISREALKAKVKSDYIKVEELSDNDKRWIKYIYQLIDNAPSVEEMEKPFITECRDTAIKENLPLYFVYYEEIGVVEVYVTETKELFEKRRCSKHLPDYKFKEAVIQYLDWYSAWKGGME